MYAALLRAAHCFFLFYFLLHQSTFHLRQRIRVTEMHLGFLFCLFGFRIWRKGDPRKVGDRTRWLNSPNVYQKVEVLETGTPDPKKITKVEIVTIEGNLN